MPTFTFPPLALAISVLSPKLIRLRYARNGKFAKRRAWAVTKDDSEFAPAKFDVNETSQEIIINTNAISIHIEKGTGKIYFSDSQNQIFCADVSSVTSVNPSVAKSIATGEHFYGFGERTYSSLERSGRIYTHWASDTAAPHTPDVDRMYVAIPIYFSVRPNLAYAVYFNNTHRSQFDVGYTDPNQIRFSADGGEMDYYVFYGPTPREVNEGIAQLLGTHPMPPRWALGYHQSRWGYKSDSEIRKLAAEFRKREIPCDVIHFDIDYMDGYRVFTWHPTRFKSPKKLIADLRRDGFRAVTIIDPGVKADKRYFVYQEGLKKKGATCKNI
ncbi:MAG: glycoside hydrolase family 31 protein [Chloroflexi bacterium]|nr:glycoside hydrolase family 31 protein [Chloroflexota bacterium]